MGTYGVELSDADAKRFGVDTVLDCDVSTLTLTEAEAVEEQTGFLIGDLVDLPAEAVWRNVRDENGDPVKRADGSIKTNRNHKALRPLVWLGLRRAGVDVPYGELDFQVLQTRIVVTADPEPEQAAPGKDPSTPASGSAAKKRASGTSAASTRRRSRTSSTSARGNSSS